MEICFEETGGVPLCYHPLIAEIRKTNHSLIQQKKKKKMHWIPAAWHMLLGPSDTAISKHFNILLIKV